MTTRFPNGFAFAEFLSAHGIIDERAVWEAEGFDGGRTMERVQKAFSQMNEGATELSHEQPPPESIPRFPQHPSDPAIAGDHRDWDAAISQEYESKTTRNHIPTPPEVP